MGTEHRGPGRPSGMTAGETRKRIVDAAREAFAEIGYDAATLQEIASRINLTRPAIHHYFSSKRQLYHEVMEETTRTLVVPAIQKAVEANTLIGRLKGFLDTAVAIQGAEPSVGSFLVTTVWDLQRHPELYQDAQSPVMASRAFIAKAIEEAINSGELELRSDTVTEQLVDTILSMMIGLGTYAVFIGTQEDLQGVSHHLLKLMAGELWEFQR